MKVSTNQLKIEFVRYEVEEKDKKPPAQNKFVFLLHRDVLTMVAGPIINYPYHATLIDKFCRDNQIPSAWVHKPDLVEIFDPLVQVKGGGHLDIYPEREVINIYGYSTAYGPFNSEYMKRFITEHPFFSHFSVRVRL